MTGIKIYPFNSLRWETEFIPKIQKARNKKEKEKDITIRNTYQTNSRENTILEQKFQIENYHSQIINALFKDPYEYTRNCAKKYYKNQKKKNINIQQISKPVVFNVYLKKVYSSALNIHFQDIRKILTTQMKINPSNVNDNMRTFGRRRISNYS